jgi:nitroreductase
VQFSDVVRHRRMVRSFRPEPIAPESLERILHNAQRAPSAGFTQGWHFLVLSGPDEVGRYWDCTLPVDRRGDFPWPGLLHAPVLVLPCVEPGAYVARYAEPDKARTGLGSDSDAWPVPYWFVDGGMASMLVLLSAVDEGLGACFFGVFDHEAAVAETFGIPPGVRIVGTIAIGAPAPDRSSGSLRRGRRPAGDIVHRGGW